MTTPSNAIVSGNQWGGSRAEAPKAFYQLQPDANASALFHSLPVELRELRLLPGEQITGFREIPFRLPPTWVPADRLIADMCSVDSIDRIGEAKMPIASRALGNRDQGEGLYEGEFARDAIEMAETLLEIHPEIARATLIRLAELSGYEDRQTSSPPFDLMRDGQICHEMRELGDPVREEYSAAYGWDYPYFGSIDATPRYITLLRKYLEHTGDTALLKHEVTLTNGRTRRSILDVAGKAAECLTKRVNENSEHVMEAGMASNLCWQVMADSPDHYHHSNGMLAQGKVSAIEVAGYTLDAFDDAARIAELVGPDAASKAGLKKGELLAHRDEMVKTIVGRYWVSSGPHGPFFANGGDREPQTGKFRRLEVSAVHQLDLLDTKLFDLLPQEESLMYVTALIHQGWNPEAGLNTQNGQRMLAGHEVRSRPSVYHNGSIWWHKVGKAAQGAIRRGAPGLGLNSMQMVVDGCRALRCYPEKVSGNLQGPPRVESVIVDAVTPTYLPDHSMLTHKLSQPGQLLQGWVVTHARSAMRTLELARAGEIGNQATHPALVRAELEALHSMKDHGLHLSYGDLPQVHDASRVAPDWYAGLIQQKGLG